MAATKDDKLAARLLARTKAEGLKDAYELGESATVGRHPTNTIVLALDSISRFHARIDKRGSFHILQDLNSSNGTLVNGERVTQMTLHHRDQVTFGNVEFEFRNESPSQAPTHGDSHGSAAGMSIVEFTDDDEARMPGSKAVLRSEEISALAEKSSFFEYEPDKKPKDPELAGVYRRLTALYKLSELLHESADEDEKVVAERVLELVFRIAKPDRGVIMTRFSRESTELDIAAVRYADAPITPQRVAISRAIMQEVMTQKVAVMTTDAQADDRFGQSESIIFNKIRSAICVPMIHSDHVMGIFHVEIAAEGRTFGREDLEFVTLVANELSGFIETQRMRREASHRQRLAAVGETVAGISHNVKNILLLMKGGSELLDRALEKGNLDNARESWSVVGRGIDKIAKLVKDMLEYSSSKKARLSKADINDMICSTAEEIEGQLVAKGITLELDLEEGLEPRIVDEMGLQRTLMNLIVNAVEAIPHAEGSITVSTGVLADESLVLKVSDNGAGIEPEKLEKVFLPFYTTKGSSGTGLGLPMCKKAIEDMGGSMKVESELNVGTTFTIVIPKLKEQSAGGPSETLQEDDG